MAPPRPTRILTTIPRRAVLAAPVAACVGGQAPAQQRAAPQPPLGGRGMASIARQKNRFFGAAVNPAQFESDAPYMDRVAAECGIVVGETQFKWEALRPKPDTYTFGEPDALVAWASSRAMQVRGHALLWHLGNPDWLAEALTPQTADKLLATHIRTVCGHFRRKLVHWDVTNEVLHVQDNQPGGFRDSVWHRAMGPRLLDVAFHTCAEADPNALRFMNEDQIEYAWDAHARKRAAILEQLAAMKSRGVPVQALGIQAHLEAGVKELDQKALSQFVADVAGLGLKVAITELDVRDNRVAADTAVRDPEVAAHARAYLDAVLTNPAVLGVLTWGLADSRSWLNDEVPREDKLPQRALPLDEGLQTKPLYDAIAAAFEAAPVR